MISCTAEISALSDPPSVLIPSTPRSGCCVNTELRVTSWSAHPAGCTGTFCSAGNSPKAHRILSLFIFLLFSFLLPPHPPTSVLAVRENNGFVGGFKTSERENKHCCSLCSKAGNSIKEVEIKEWGCSSSSSSSKAITTRKGKPWQLKEGWNLACPWSCSYYYNTAWLKISNQTKEIPAGKG